MLIVVLLAAFVHFFAHAWLIPQIRDINIKETRAFLSSPAHHAATPGRIHAITTWLFRYVSNLFADCLAAVSCRIKSGTWANKKCWNETQSNWRQPTWIEQQCGIIERIAICRYPLCGANAA
jgi:hypothetical protein